jgi:hypothetical protein
MDGHENDVVVGCITTTHVIGLNELDEMQLNIQHNIEFP